MRRALALVFGLVGTAVILLGTAPTPASAASAAVSAQYPYFAPAQVTINVGDKVTWTNQDMGISHTVTADQGAFDRSLPAGQSISITFSTPGTFAYHCSIHPVMTGTVTVMGPTTTTSPPTTRATTTTTRPATTTTRPAATTTTSAAKAAATTTTTTAAPTTTTVAPTTTSGPAPTVQLATPAKSGGSGSGPLVAGLVVAGLAVAGGVGTVVVRRRRL
jgi:plastocyanin